MKRKSEPKETVHNKIYNDLINVNYSTKNKFKEERKYSIKPNKNIFNSDFKLWYNNQIILKNNFTPKNKSTGILQGRRLSKENYNHEKIETEPKLLTTNNLFRRNNNLIDDYYPQHTFMTRQHSRNKKEILNHNTDKIKYKPTIIKSKNEIENKNLFPFHKENLLNVRVKVHKFLTKEFYKKKKTNGNEEENNQNENEKIELKEDIILKTKIGSTLESTERKSDNLIIKNKVNHIENIKTKQNLTSKQSFEDINKRNQDLQEFLNFTNNIVFLPNSTKNIFKKDIQIITTKYKNNTINHIKKNLNVNKKNFQIPMKKYNSCKKMNNVKNKTNNIEEIIKIEENDLNNINKNKHLRENLTDHLIQRINLNPNKHKNLNHNTKQFVLKKVEKNKKNKS